MILEIIGYAFLGLVTLVFIACVLRDVLVKRISEAFELGKKMERLRHQLGQEVHDELLVGAGIDPAKLPGRVA